METSLNEVLGNVHKAKKLIEEVIKTFPRVIFIASSERLDEALNLLEKTEEILSK